LSKNDLIERNKTLEKLVKELEWQLHEQEAVKNARYVLKFFSLEKEMKVCFF